MKDRRDRFAYTNPRQIKIIPKAQAQALGELQDLVERERLDAAKVLDLVREHLDALRHEPAQTGRTSTD